MADSVGAALLLVLDTLAPAERLAFVLHDLFAVPFDEIGAIVGRSPAAARQLASRARRRVQGTGEGSAAEPGATVGEPDAAVAGSGAAATEDRGTAAGGPGAAGAGDRGGAAAGGPGAGAAAAGERHEAAAGRAMPDVAAAGRPIRDAAAGLPVRDDGAARRREVVAAFLAASRGGDFDALLALLDPDAVARADAAAVAAGADAEVRGAAAVAGTFAGRAKAARLVLLDGEPGLVWSYRGEVRMAFAFTVLDDHVADVELIADPARLAAIGVEPLP